MTQTASAQPYTIDTRRRLKTTAQPCASARLSAEALPLASLDPARVSGNTSTSCSHGLLASCTIYATRRVEMASAVVVSTSDNVLMDGLI